MVSLFTFIFIVCLCLLLFFCRFVHKLVVMTVLLSLRSITMFISQTSKYIIRVSFISLLLLLLFSSRIATDPSSWVDTYIDWLNPNTPCCRYHPDNHTKFCPYSGKSIFYYSLNYETYRITKPYYVPIIFCNYPTIVQNSNSTILIISFVFILFVNQ